MGLYLVPGSYLWALKEVCRVYNRYRTTQGQGSKIGLRVQVQFGSVRVQDLGFEAPGARIVKALSAVLRIYGVRSALLLSSHGVRRARVF